MSSYYELMWRDDELTSYTTDKLNFIYNAIDHPLSVRYRQLSIRLAKSRKQTQCSYSKSQRPSY